MPSSYIKYWRFYCDNHIPRNPLKNPLPSYEKSWDPKVSMDGCEATLWNKATQVCEDFLSSPTINVLIPCSSFCFLWACYWLVFSLSTPKLACCKDSYSQSLPTRGPSWPHHIMTAGICFCWYFIFFQYFSTQSLRRDSSPIHLFSYAVLNHWP